MDKKQYEPTNIVVYKEIKRDEIDFIELFKIVLKYKKFIISFVLASLVLTTIYLFLAKSIYRVEAKIELGSYITLNKDNPKKVLFVKPKEIASLITYKFDKSKASNKTYPRVIVKDENSLLSLKVEDFTNKEALKDLQNIVEYIRDKEAKSKDRYKRYIRKEIALLKASINEYKSNIENLNKSLTSQDNKDLILSQIVTYDNLLQKSKIDEERYNYLLSTIEDTKLLQEIKQREKAIKPNKKLIILVSLIGSLALAIFFSLVMEFTKER